MRICGQPRHHDSKKQVLIVSSENYDAIATRLGRIPQSGLVQWPLCRYRHNAHASGHSKRLNRDSITEAAPFGSAIYSVEEIVAEMTAAYLCGITGIENRTIDNSAAYVANWLRHLRDQRKLIIHAAAQAQRACDYI